MIPGHEFAGDIVEVGSAVQHLKVGDRVTPCIVIGCGDCDMCIEGKEVLCDNLVETGIHVDGAFAEYVRVPAKVCRKMRDTTTYDQGASVDPVASAYRTVKASRITSKDVCCVYGAGPIGLYAVQLIRLRGVKTVIAWIPTPAPSGWSWPKPSGPTTPSTSPGRTLYSGSERSPTAPWPTTSRTASAPPPFQSPP